MSIDHLPVMTETAAREAGYYVVPEHMQREAEIAFTNLSKRALRRSLSSAPILVWQARGEWRRVWYVDNGDGETLTRSRMVPALFASIAGNAPKLSDWELSARLIETETGERMIAAVPGKELPMRFRTTGMECEHCNMDRARRDVFVVHNVETGDYKQVGRTCLRDFLGHDPAALLLAFVATNSIAASFDETCGNYCSASAPVYDTIELLEYTAAAIRRYGWTSRKTSNETGKAATADNVLGCFNAGASAREAREYLEPTEADAKLARDTLAWVRGTLANQLDASDYEHNLIISLRHAVIDARSIGIAASSVSAYLRALSRQAELETKRAADAASDHVGAIGERLRKLPATVERKHLVESSFGSSYLVKLRTDAGHVLSWFCSGRGANDVKPGDKVTLTGTVKAHKEYKGTRETQLSRCVLSA